MKTRVGVTGSLLLSLFALTGCGSSGGSNPPPPPAKPEFFYMVVNTTTPPNAPSFQLASFTIDTTNGSLTPTGTQAWSQLYPQIVVDPTSKFLYASSLGAQAWAIFSINAKTGMPSQNGAFIVPTPICGLGCTGGPSINPGMLAFDPAGKYMFYASSSFGLPISPQIGALSVDTATGALNLVSGSPFSATNMPLSVATHPSGKFVYTEDVAAGMSILSLASVSGFAVDSSTGALTPVPGSPFGVTNANTVGYAIEPHGKFLYVSTGISGILGWQIDQTTGTLTTLPGSPFLPGTATFGARFDNSGKFLYSSAGASGGVLGFGIDPTTGILTSLSGSPFAANLVLSAPTIDPSGKFAYAVDFKNKAIVTLSVGGSGALTNLTSTPITGIPGEPVIVRAP